MVATLSVLKRYFNTTVAWVGVPHACAAPHGDTKTRTTRKRRWLQVHDSLKAAPPHNARMQAKSNAAGAHSAQRGPAVSIADAHSSPRRRSVDSAVGTSEPQAGGSGGIGEEGPPENGGTATRTMQGYTMLSNAWAGSKSVLDYFVLRTHHVSPAPASPAGILPYALLVIKRDNEACSRGRPCHARCHACIPCIRPCSASAHGHR